MTNRLIASLLTACLFLALIAMPRLVGWESSRLVRSANVPAAPTSAVVDASGCTTSISRTLSAPAIRDCEQVTVTTRLTSACRGCPGGLHVVFIVNLGELGAAQRAGEAMVDELERFQRESDTEVAAAFVYYWPYGTRVAVPMTERLSQVRGTFSGRPIWIRYGGYENGASAGLGILRNAAKGSDVRCDIIVFMGRLKEHDGPTWDVYRREMRNAAQMMRQDASTLMIYCVGGGDISCLTMRQVPESPRHYAEAPDTQKLARAIRDRIGGFLVEAPAGLRSLGLDQGLPSGLAYVTDSAVPPLGGVVSDTVTTTLHWRWDGPIIAADYTTTYRVAPTAPMGRWRLSALAHLEPLVGGRYEVPAPPLAIDVTGPCAPTPSVTPSPTATAARIPSPTAPATATEITRASATPIATPTELPTATTTPAPGRLYLPLALRERCVPGQKRMDVALVIDASTSMRDDVTSAGRTKLSAAIEAAMAFVATLALPLDQASVVVFNSDAQVVQDLTGQRSSIDAALAAIPRLVRQQTRIDRGIEEAARELGSGRRNPDNQAVMIVLTDGLANPEPPSTAVQRAAEAKRAGINIFVIGLGTGAELNVPELAQMASVREYFYRAPDGEDLLAIYRTIAVEIPCPAAAFWARR